MTARSSRKRKRPRRVVRPAAPFEKEVLYRGDGRRFVFYWFGKDRRDRGKTAGRR